MLKGYCISDMGIQFVDKIRFASKADIINKLLDQVNEFAEILTIGKSFPGQDYFDLRDELSRIKTPGSYIEQEALFDLKTSLNTIQEIYSKMFVAAIENIVSIIHDEAPGIKFYLCSNPLSSTHKGPAGWCALQHGQ